MSAPTDPVEEMAPPDSFGTVLNSVQGIQQRLGEFTIDEIRTAETSARTLIARLSELQKKLNHVAEIQRLMAAVHGNASASEGEGIKLPDSNALDNSIRIQAIAQANNLIQFPRPKKTSKENYEHPMSPSGLKLIQPDGWQPETDGFVGARPEPNDGGGDTPAPMPEATDVPQPLGEQTPATDSETGQPEMRLETTSGDSTAPPEDFPSHAGEAELSDLEIAKIFAEEFAQSADGQTPELLADAPAFEFANNEGSDFETTAADPASADFDQRLLDDLIKNYGEFAVSPALSTSLDPSTAPGRGARNKDSKMEPQIPGSESVKRSSPSVRKNGELDRELKKIVKDYGEYDLYSHRRRMSLKTGGIAAVLLLAGLLAGYYFFYSSDSAAVVPAPETGSTAVPSLLEGGISKEPVDRGQTDRAEQNQASEQSPRPLETITPQ